MCHCMSLREMDYVNKAPRISILFIHFFYRPKFMKNGTDSRDDGSVFLIIHFLTREKYRCI